MKRIRWYYKYSKYCLMEYEKYFFWKNNREVKMGMNGFVTVQIYILYVYTWIYCADSNDTLKINS